MNPAYLNLQAQTGDVLLVKGDSLEQKAIQLACPPFCHVAQLIRTFTGLMVVEMMEPHGYQSWTFDEWYADRVASGDKVFFGQAPDVVRRNGQAIVDRQAIYESGKQRRYHFDELPLVWLSQVTGKEYGTDGEVCSLLVGNDWEAAGYEIHGNPSPGSFLELCESVSLIR